MTRFGEILPIWHYSTSPSAIAKSFNSDLAKFYTILGIFCFLGEFTLV